MITLFEFNCNPLYNIMFTVDGRVIPDTIADDVLDKLRRDYYNIDDLFDVEKLLPHMERHNIITEHDIHQIKCQSTQAAKGQLLFNAVKSKGQRSTRLSLLYRSIYDSHEAEYGHGKHYDALGILAKQGMIRLTNMCYFILFSNCQGRSLILFGNVQTGLGLKKSHPLNTVVKFSM